MLTEGEEKGIGISDLQVEEEEEEEKGGRRKEEEERMKFDPPNV